MDVHPDEHRRHLDNAEYQAAIERAAIREIPWSTKRLEELTVKDESKHAGTSQVQKAPTAT